MKGWSIIINDLEEKLKPYNAFIIEIKEKWGVLRVNYSFHGSEEEKEIIRLILNEAEDKSSVTCEYCGKHGDMVNLNGWLKTLCKGCAKKGTRPI